jgi:Carbohydrate-selective porin, OprB family/S-layer homology domain
VSKLLRKISNITPFVLGASLLIAPNALAGEKEMLEQIDLYSNDNAIDQVTNVSELKDVSPGDWAYEALRSLVERYGCIAGYPNGTFRGNRPMTRYEFAAGLNACLNQIERLISESQATTQEDIDKLSRLVQEFQTELAALGTRVDNIEGRVAFLEEHQFSTTTKLEGQVIMALGSVLGGQKADGSGVDVENVAVFGYRARLELNTSFTGSDLLFTRLSTGNFPAFSEKTLTLQGDLGFAQPDNNSLGLEVLLYRYPFGDSTEVVIGATGFAADDIANTVNFLDGDGAEGAISAFGTRNPIFFQPGDTGLGIVQQFGEKVEVSLGYFAGEAEDPSDGNGLFNGSFSALGQILFKPSDELNIALTYIHGYNQSGTGTGSLNSNLLALDTLNLDPDSEFIDAAVDRSNNDSFGTEFSFKVSDHIILGGWGGYSKITATSGVTDVDLDVFNWAATLAITDVGSEGSVIGLIIGMEPWVDSSSNAAIIPEDADTSLHLEAFYQYKLNDNIAITPGIVLVTSPGNNENNDDLFIGTVRTTFSF